MKKTFRILSVMALAGLVVFGSCKKNENNNNSTNENGTISAGIVQPNNGAKTSITINGDEGIIKWTSGDQIVVGDDTKSGTFTLFDGAEEVTGSFKCAGFEVDDLDYYAAAYPASAATLSGTAVTFNIPAEQTLTRIEDGFGNGANPMVAYSEAPLEQLEFKSVFGGVGIKLQAEIGACITKLVLTDNTNSLWGQFSVADVAVDNPRATYVSGGGNSITLNLPAGGLTVDASHSYNVYIMLPVDALSNGFTLAAYVGETKVTEKSTTLTDATISLNQLNNAVTYNVVLPAGQANTAEGVVAIINDPEQTGPVTVISGELDFADPVTGEPATISTNNQQIVFAPGAEVVVKNLNVTRTNGGAGIIVNDATVEFDNVDLEVSGSSGRALRIDDNANVTIRNSVIRNNGTGADQRGISIYPDAEGSTVTLENCTVEAPYYAINLNTDGEGNTVNLINTTINGWCALNIRGEGHTINCTNCTLRGTNDKGVSNWNSFATIAFNSENQNCTVNLVDCDVIAESPSGNKQYIVRMYTGNNTISADNACTVSKGTGNPNTPTFWQYIAGDDTTDSNWNIDDATFEAFTAAWGGSKGSFIGKPAAAQVSETESSKK